MNILLLGATGSIGKSVLSVINQNNSELSLFGIALNKNTIEANNIVKQFAPSYVYIDDCDAFKNQNSAITTQYINGDSALADLINHEDVDVIICAISGFAGLKAAYIAASTGKKILLANKESVVAG